MIDLTQSFSLTDFQRNAKEFLEYVNRERKPVLLTVNGRIQAVVIDPKTYQTFYDELMRAAWESALESHENAPTSPDVR